MASSAHSLFNFSEDPSVYRAGDRLVLGSVGVSCAVEDLYLGLGRLR
jgi:hypothetical protein